MLSGNCASVVAGTEPMEMRGLIALLVRTRTSLAWHVQRFAFESRLDAYGVQVTREHLLRVL